MKKITLTTLTILLAAGHSSVLFGQGLFIDNTSNSDPSPTATSNGFVFMDSAGNRVLSTIPTLNVQLMGGLTAGAVNASLASLTGANALLNAFPGAYLDANGTQYNIPGLTANTVGFFDIFFWAGNFPTYDAAVAGNGMTGHSGVFSQLTGGGSTPPNPPTVPPGLGGMPATLVSNVPEPSTMVLVGLGLASLLVFRRRN
jgi:hypothetical protein